MKNWKICASFVLIAFSTTGCTHMLAGLLEDSITAMRYVSNRGKEFLNGYAVSEQGLSDREFFGEFESEFIPLSDGDIHSQTVEYVVPQAKEVPGEPGGKIPGIGAFHNPSKSLQSLFAKIYFNTDQHLPKSKEHYQTLNRISNYLKKHPEVYVFVSGHCDERASEAYNLALGTRRSNYIRNFLIKSGVNPNQLYTISYGKEKPQALGHSPTSWAKNRRVAFKIYENRVTL